MCKWHHRAGRDGKREGVGKKKRPPRVRSLCFRSCVHHPSAKGSNRFGHWPPGAAKRWGACLGVLRYLVLFWSSFGEGNRKKESAAQAARPFVVKSRKERSEKRLVRNAFRQDECVRVCFVRRPLGRGKGEKEKERGVPRRRVSPFFLSPPPSSSPGKKKERNLASVRAHSRVCEPSSVRRALGGGARKGAHPPLKKRGPDSICQEREKSVSGHRVCSDAAW